MAQDNWWHLIALTPVVIPIGSQLGTVGIILIAGFAASYPVAMYKDAIYVSQTSSKWDPSPRTYASIGLLVMLTFGILSYIVSPIYLYRRYKYNQER